MFFERHGYQPLPGPGPGEPPTTGSGVKPVSDPVRRPAHYTKGEIEVIDFIEQIVANYPPEIGYHIGNVLKYVARGPLKGALPEDLSKAEWYLKRAINKSITLKTPVKRD